MKHWDETWSSADGIYTVLVRYLESHGVHVKVMSNPVRNSEGSLVGWRHCSMDVSTTEEHFERMVEQRKWKRSPVVWAGTLNEDQL